MTTYEQVTCRYCQRKIAYVAAPATWRADDTSRSTTCEAGPHHAPEWSQ